MSPAVSGTNTSRPLPMAFPLPGGRWALRTGTAHILDGFLYAIELPGLGMRRGEGDGLTAVFYAVHALSREADGGRRGTVVRWWVEDGKVARMETVAEGVLLKE